MRLQFLEIQGFKSFPDKVRISFPEPYTGIVGPNGAGKSNISDAVRWVLGEQSTKSLRGGRMEDVIFGGTQLRRAMGFAQVTLHLDNSDQRISDMGQEVTVSRRYYRSGDSEYLINGNTVRLRDVREMFMDTGLGRDGYSIIGQGRISEIVAARSDERRQLFEEASGIAKYRYRKNEAERKLTQTEDNLSRLRDILGELEGRIEPLREQSEKAQEFLELSGRRKSLEITLYCDTIERSRDNMNHQKEKIETARQDYSLLEKALEDLNGEVEGIYDNNRRLNDSIDMFNQGIITNREHIAGIEQAVAVLNNDMMHADEQLRTLHAERQTLVHDESAIDLEITRLHAEISRLESELGQTDSQIDMRQSELSELISLSELAGQKTAAATRTRDSLQQALTDLRLDNVSSLTAMQSLSERGGTIDEQRTALDERLIALRVELGDNRAYWEELNRESADRDNQIQGFRLKHDSRKHKQEELKKELDSLDFEIRDLAHRAKILSDMDRNMEGFSQSVRAVIEAAHNHRLRGIIGTVASLITIQEGLETAIETALGITAQNIVVNDEASAKSGIAMLKETRAGRATFLPLDTIKPSHFDARERLGDEGIVGLASELVSCDSLYSSIISHLLGRVIIADSLDTASVCARRISYRYRIVTLDGQVINTGGSYTGGYTARQGGLFTRKNEIDRLEKRMEEIRQSTVLRRRDCETLDLEVAGLQAELTALNSDQITSNEDRIRLESVVRSLESEERGLTASIQLMEQERTQIQADLTGRQQRISQGETDMRQIMDKLNLLDDVGDDGATLAIRHNELSGRIGELRVSRAGLVKDIETCRMLIEQQQRQRTTVDERGAGIAENEQAIAQLNEKRQQDIEERESGILSLRQKSDELRRFIEDAAKERTMGEGRVTELRGRYDEISKQREDVVRDLSRLEERQLNLQKDFDMAVAKLWEEYELTRQEAEAYRIPISTITELRQQVASLRTRIRNLGTVNVGAIEELREVSQRYDFLHTQTDDVEKSRAELLKLIRTLESEMVQIFTRNFSEISSRFRVVFSELFGGGQAALSLSDPEDVLGSGIVIDVQPPGKVIKNLAALSGGEQALVAIALYFSILDVNPSPFCFLDEIDSALDEANVARFAAYLRRTVAVTQIIAITHRRGTMEAADTLYGVTMQEEGVSKLLRLDPDEAHLVIG